MSAAAGKMNYRANCANALCAFSAEGSTQREVASAKAAHQAQTGHRVSFVSEAVRRAPVKRTFYPADVFVVPFSFGMEASLDDPDNSVYMPEEGSWHLSRPAHKEGQGFVFPGAERDHVLKYLSTYAEGRAGQVDPEQGRICGRIVGWVRRQRAGDAK